MDGYEDFEEIHVKEVYIIDALSDPTPVVLLENEKGEMLPIYIGHLEAMSISNVLKSVSHPRPMPHDLLIDIFKRMNTKVEGVLIDDKIDQTYYARLLLRKGKKTMQFDARPSDCIALALRANAPIKIRKKVLESSEIDASRLEGARIMTLF
ncbi:MAG: bifunctional nuclease family protein [Methanosarcinaceae archaeon]|nr:bifunctional nuclease family protein [Methanosarcinaceae archaeon]MDD4496592.1 bifunctional nuclease family protein [Methanosarcinaceae archaeon]